MKTDQQASTPYVLGAIPSALVDENIVYQISGETTLNEFNYAAMNNVGPVAGINLSFYELATDEVNNLFRFFTIKDVKKNEEICTNYGDAYEKIVRSVI
jgi:hypothetical protein